MVRNSGKAGRQPATPEIDGLPAGLVERLERFIQAKSRWGRNGMRTIGCLCCKPDGLVRRYAAHRYLPMPYPEDIHCRPARWGVYDRRGERFLSTSELETLTEAALMAERLTVH